MRMLIIAAVFSFFLLQCSGTRSAAQKAMNTAEAVMVKKLPVDNNVIIGKLDNGLTYYIRKNTEPENRAELRLAVDAGSMMEDPKQLGLAHFVEHMAFNGTENFEKQELIDYVESIGVRFGPHLNAYTSFDETVYMLQVPTDSAGMLDTGIQILEEWAHRVSFTDEEIDKERGVVVEEWRTGRGAGMRMLDKQLPVLFKDSRYAERLPIGKKEILETFDYETLRSFYRDWYRPELMAVIVVGDVDVAAVEAQIKQRFSTIPASTADVRERKSYEVPGHAEPLYSIATDPEAQRNSVSILYKRPVSEQNNEEAYRRSLVGSLFLGMFNNRLYELTQQPEPPYLGAYAGESNFIRAKNFAQLGAVVKDGQIESGLKTLLIEAERAKRFGFTATELEREKTSLMRGIEQAYREKSKTKSRNYASEYIRNFLEDEPIPGIDFEYELYQKFVPGITLEEINTLVGKWLTDENRVVLVDAPEKEGLTAPTEAGLQNAFATATQSDITAYVDQVSNDPLVAEVPEPGTILSETMNEEVGTTTWKLSNGITVVLKPTDFKNDQVLFNAYSTGGHSLVDDRDFISASYATQIVEQGGIGNFSLIELQKKLTGKVVNVSPYIRELNEGISGSASPEDLETMFQLIHLYITSPRRDEQSYEAYRAQISAYLQNYDANPANAFRDTIRTTMAQNHFRARPISQSHLDEMNLDRSLAIYKDRFADTDDFTFIFVGNIDPVSLKPLVSTYIATLPTTPREETWADVGMLNPEGIIKKTVYRGIEPKSQVRITFTGPLQWNIKNRFELNMMTAVLRIKLREALREDKGGTYGVGVSARRSHFPRSEYSLNIGFGCDPERVDELITTVFDELKALQKSQVDDIYMQKVKETRRRGWETDVKENRFWLNSLSFYLEEGEDPAQIINLPTLIEGVTKETIQSAAQQYIDLKNYVQIVLKPEASTGVN
ncbi:MAG: M16 family metallopeptidase [Calditrichia bacterium]